MVYDRSNRFLAVSLWDAESPIRLRILHVGKPRRIDSSFWREIITVALARRVGVADQETNGLRWIYGENDGLPGLIVDGYAQTLVIKLYSAAWFPWLEDIKAQLVDLLSPERIVLRLSRNTSPAKHLRDGSILSGSKPADPVVFCESGIFFRADVLKGQKTGFFLDQRENRRRMESLSKNRTVLNAFAYSGGFSLYAARGGARHVTSIDQSPHALAELQENWRLNGNVPSIRNCRHEEVQADVFAWLPDRKDAFELVVIDPPSLASRKSDREKALQAYQQLARGGLGITKKDGHLVCCSCSSHVSRDDFIGLTKKALAGSSRRAEVIDFTGHAPDHPRGIPELDYLKAVWIRLLN